MSRSKLLFKAVKRGNLDLVKQLILRRANVNYRSIKGNSPLFIAVKTRNLAIVKELIEANACLDPPCGEGISPIVVAVQNGDLDIVKKLVEADDFNDRTLSGVSLTENGSTTALHVAVDTGNLEMVLFLLSNGASLGDGDNNKNTPLHIALKNPSMDIIKELIKYTRSINDLNSLEETPLHTAVFRRLLSMIIKENDSKEYPLDILRILILKGAKVTAFRFYKLYSPLSVAINLYKEDPMCTQTLIKYGMFMYANKSSWKSICNFDQYYFYYETLLKYCTCRYADEFILKTIETFREESFYDEVVQYVGNCELEIEKMKRYKVNGQVSLFELVMECTVNNNANFCSEIEDDNEVLHNILDSFCCYRFPIYWDLISSVFNNRKHLESKLQEYYVFTSSSDCLTDSILNHICLFELMKYLPISDLVNLTVVFFEFHEHTSINNISNMTICN